MKNLLTVSFLCFSIALFGQNLLAKKSYQNYNADSALWLTNTIETWAYDLDERAVLETWWNEYQGAFQPYNNRKVETAYLQNGQLEFVKNQTWGDTTSRESFTEYVYNNEKELIEIIFHYSSSDGNPSFNKETFENNLAENRRTKKTYSSYNNPNNWVLDHQSDSFFNANGDLIKHTILNFDEDGNQINQRWWTYDFSPENKLLQEGYWLQDNNTDTMFLFSRQNFSYDDDNREVSVLYEKLAININEWQTQHLTITQLDEVGREVYYFWENYRGTIIDTTERHHSFTDKGELFVYKELKTSHLHNDNPLYQVRLDSFVYEYNDKDLLIKKKNFSQYYEDPFVLRTTQYEYYCNDLLRKEFYENLPQIYRILYEYYGQADCNLMGEKPDLKIFPNPSNGLLSIESELLVTENVQIQLYSITGQQIFSKKQELIAFRTDLQLPELAAGTYIIVVQNNNTQISEQLIIH